MMTPAQPPPTRALGRRPRDIRQMLRGGFDWIDAASIVPMGVLLYLVFGRSGIDFFLETGGGASFGVLVFAPFVVRRAVFGPPKRGEMRKGVLWSVAGVVGLLSIVLGTGLVALSVWGDAQHAGTPAPDFQLAEARTMALKIGGVGVLMIALGAVLDGIRYRRHVPSAAG